MRTAASGLLLMAALASAVLSSGCFCSPQDVNVDVKVTMEDEEVRTLPMLTSGGTQVAGLPLPVPDSHGYIDLKVSLAPREVSPITVIGLRVALDVAGKNLPARITNVDGSSSWSEDRDSREWEGSLRDESKVRLHWAVDRDRAAKVTDLLLTEGAPYTLTVLFTWRLDDCAYVGSGEISRPFSDFVQASVNAKTFEPAGTPALETAGDKAGFQADYRIRSGLPVNVNAATAQLVYFASSGSAALGAAVFGDVAWSVNDVPGSAVAPGDRLHTFSSRPGIGLKAYAASGVMAPPGTQAGAGLYVLLETLDYAPQDPTLGTQTDVFAYGIIK